MTANNKTIYEQIEDNNITDLQTISDDDFLNLLKWQNSDENDNTVLHVAFKEANENILATLAQKAEKLLKKPPSLADELTKALNIENVGGFSPLGRILQKEETAQKTTFQTVINTFSNQETKKAVLLSYGNNNETLLHNLVEEGSPDLLNAILEEGKKANCLLDILTAQDKQGNTPLHVAALENNQDFLSAVLHKASANSINIVLAAKETTNQNTVVHYALESKNAEIVKLVLEYVAKLTNPQALLKTENVSFTATQKLLSNSNFIAAFKGLENETKKLVLEAIKEGKEKLDEDNKNTITNLYTEVQTNQELKTKFLEIVDLDKDAQNIKEIFETIIIQAKLEEAEKSIFDGLTETTKEALEQALNQINNYKANFNDDLPQNFGDSVTNAVKEKLDKVASTAAESIADKKTSADVLKSAYETAKAKIEEFAEVYAQVGADKDAAIKALDDAVQAELDKVEQEQIKLIQETTDLTTTIFNNVFKLTDTFNTTVCQNSTLSFGASLFTFVTTKLKKIETEAASSITGENAAALKSAYDNAKAKIEEFAEVYNKVGANKDAAIKALDDAVQNQATAVITGVCKASQTAYTKKTEAQNCIDTINSFTKDFSFLTFNNLLSFANSYIIKQNSLSVADAKKGLSLAFYYAKDLTVRAEVQRYIDEPTSDTKKPWAEHTQLLMKVRSGIEGKAPGIDSGKIDDVKYNPVYSSDRLLKLTKRDGSENTSDLEKFVKNTSSDQYLGFIESNANSLQSQACKILKVDGECTPENIYTAIQEKVCKPHSSDALDHSTNAYKAFCEASSRLSGLDSLSHNSLDFLFESAQ